MLATLTPLLIQLVPVVVGALALLAAQKWGVPAPSPTPMAPAATDPVVVPAPAPNPATPVLNVVLPAAEQMLQQFLQQAFAKLAAGSLATHAVSVTPPAVPGK